MRVDLDDTIEFITSNNQSFVEGLIRLTNFEIDYKEISMVKAVVKVGAFPGFKELKDYDFGFQKLINQA